MIPSILASEIKWTVADYLDTTFSFQDDELGESLKNFLLHPGRGMFKGPYLSVRLPFLKAKEGEKNLEVFPFFTPYVHQLKSFERLSSKDKNPLPTLVTTGTGSGKTECFTYPILDHCYRNQKKGIKAIILYPMNALASDQAKRLAEMIQSDERLQHIRVGMYVGGQGTYKKMGPDHVIDDRETLRKDPPDILLTNYKMLDYLLIRPEDRSLWQHNKFETLKYLVLDELHTYDGAQGSDVANLIRRLKARLNIEDGQVAMVGTSATIAGGDQNSAQTLTEFASSIFGEHFEDNSVILEERIRLDEFLNEETYYYDLPSDQEKLIQDVGMSQEEYLNQQMKVWFGNKLESLQLGVRLKQHYFLRVLLEGFRNEIAILDELVDRLCKRDPEFAAKPKERQEEIVHSFISLISHAKLLDGRSIPFLQVQVQLWIREMRRLLRRVSETPDFFWKDGSNPNTDIGLPMYYCRECGHSGWLTYQIEGDGPLQKDSVSIYSRFFDKHRFMKYMYIDDGEDIYVDDQQVMVNKVFISPKDLSLHDDQDDKECYVSIVLREAKVTSGKGKVPHDRHSCPKCDADDAIIIAGSQAASLASVAISHLYTSPFNEDKKLLVFTDSVQDASHRASFFENRTYRFNLRTAIQTALQNANTDIPLSELPTYFFDFWMKAFQKESKIKNPVQHFVATFMPSDLHNDSNYKQFIRNKKEVLPDELKVILFKRLSWELIMEYGLSAKIGRTLDKVKSSTVFIDSNKLNQLTDKVSILLSNDFGNIQDFSEEKIKQFLLGLFMRLKLKGGIHHLFLNTFRNENGKSTYLLSKDRQPHISPMPGSYPRFLTDDKMSKNFDSFITSGNNQSWAVDWMRRSLSYRLSISQFNEIYSHVMRLANEIGILDKVSKGNFHNYGLRSDVLFITTNTEGIQCSKCNYRLTVSAHQLSEWIGATCRRYRCDGSYMVEVTDRQSYYRNLYSKGHIQRIFTEEHTGLLERDKREEVERLFKSSAEDRVADAPNLLTCTPTLEMGIDVGDLSATMLNSVPPTTANYVQRVGRAGRKTGNAFIITMAKASKHDLYFYEEPLTMMAGSVAPPGSYLDAPEMLKRHFFAFCMDTWARDDVGASSIPNKVQVMLTQHKKGEFPANFLKFYDQHKQALIESFISLYDETLSNSNKLMLQDYVSKDELKYSVHKVLGKVENELQKLKRLSAKIGTDLRKLEENKVSVDNYDLKVRELEHERRLLFRMMEDIKQQYPLELLTNEGLLPNYAFPETGVKLKAVIKKRKPNENEEPYEVLEWIRPAKAAIKEFSPYNTFYGSRRKIIIDQLDTGGENHSKIETWKFCNHCSHLELVAESHYKSACPSCGSSSWSDVGQNRAMLKQDYVQANMDDIISSTADEADERESNRYHIKHFFDIKQENWDKAYVIDEIPFGYEYLKEVTLREINFGFQQQLGKKMDIGGEEISRDGFKVCQDCGIVQKPSFIEGKEPRHRFNCKYNRPNLDQKDAWTDLILYREVTSEAIRILLPISTIKNSDKLYTFKACIELGLRKWYRGNPGHLVVKEYIEPIQGEDYGKRHFLIIYDEVPGGTGYLKNLVETNTFLQVLQKAYEALITCDCTNDEHRDGCYKCLYAYQNQYEIDSISRRLGIKLLKHILNHKDKIEQITTLSNVAIESVVESELEEKFILKLKDYIDFLGVKGAWKQTVYEGKPSYEIVLKNGMHWRIVPQVAFNHLKGVNVPSKPDFVFYPLERNTSLKAIAVFTDGFKYHVKPYKSWGSVGEDVRKRMAIRDSGKFVSWTLTWDDVEEFNPKEIRKLSDSTLLNTIMEKQLQILKKTLKNPLDDSLWKQNKMAQFVNYLLNPKIEYWEQYAFLIGLSNFEKRTINPEWAFNKIDEVSSSVTLPTLDVLSDVTQGSNFYVARSNIAENQNFISFITFPISTLQEFMVYAKSQIQKFSVRGLEGVIRLEDDFSIRNKEYFKRLWNEFWRLVNLLQFLPNIKVVTKELIEEYGAEGIAESAIDADTLVSEEWNEIIEIVDESCSNLLKSAMDINTSIPTVGYEVSNENGTLGEIELAWEERKFGVVLKHDEKLINLLKQRGWTVYSVSELETNIAALKEQLL